MDRILEKIFFEKILTTRWRLFQRSALPTLIIRYIIYIRYIIHIRYIMYTFQFIKVFSSLIHGKKLNYLLLIHFFCRKYKKSLVTEFIFLLRTNWRDLSKPVAYEAFSSNENTTRLCLPLL